MIQDIKDEVLSSDPLYTIRDNSGNVLNDNVDISLKTPITQEGTPINRALFRNLQGDLYTQDRYNEIENITHKTWTEDVALTGNIFPNSVSSNWTQINEKTHWVYNSTGAILTASGSYVSEGDLPIDVFGAYWQSNTSSSSWIKLKLPKATKITKMKARITSSNTDYFSKAYIEGSNDDSSWTTLYTVSSYQSAVTEMILSNANYYKYYRIRVLLTGNYRARVHNWATSEYYGPKTFTDYYEEINLPLTSYETGKIVNIQGGRTPNPNGYKYIQEDIIPKIWDEVTADTEYVSSDGARLTASSRYSSGIQASYACDGDTSNGWKSDTSINPWLKIEFPSTKMITKMKIYCTAGVDASNLNNIKIQGSNDDSTWVDLYTTTEFQSSLTEVALTNIDFYKFYRIIYDWKNSQWAYVAEWQVSEYVEPSSYIYKFTNPYLNINNIGAKQINGTINYGEKYTLVYNGESWDIISTMIVTGNFTATYNTQTNINVGFKPKMVIIYSIDNNNNQPSSTNHNATYYMSRTPLILTDAYIGEFTSSNDLSGAITNTGFYYRPSQSVDNSKLYYIAIR